jgi:hypothetical protein
MLHGNALSKGESPFFAIAVTTGRARTPARRCLENVLRSLAAKRAKHANDELPAPDVLCGGSIYFAPRPGGVPLFHGVRLVGRERRYCNRADSRRARA